PQFLDPVPPTGLAACMSLTAGVVTAGNPTGFWKFLPTPSIPSESDPYLESEKFASETRVTMTVQDTARLRAIPRTGGGPSEAVLTPKGGRSSVDVVLSNLCLDDPEHETRGIEGDFAVYYDLLSSYAGPFIVPHRVTGGPGGGQGGGQGTVHGGATRTPSCVD